MSVREYNDNQIIVIANGSSSCKSGFAADKAPRFTTPTIVGRARSGIGNENKNDSFVGDEAQKRRDVLDLTYPIKNGIISDFDGMEKIWQYIFSEQLHIEPNNYAILMSEPPLNSKPNNLKMMEIMFEKFNVPAMRISMEAELALYAAGCITGVVVDVGDNSTHAVPIYEGNVLDDCIETSKLGGRDVTNYLTQLLSARCEKQESEIIGDIKEKLSYVALDYNADMGKANNSSNIEKSYELPNKQSISLSKELFQCTEILFNPADYNETFIGVHKTTFTSLKKSPIDTRRDLYKNIVLCGGSTMLPGFVDRFEKELSALAPPKCTVQLLAPDNRHHSVWIGGASLATTFDFQSTFLTKEKYQLIHKANHGLVV